MPFIIVSSVRIWILTIITYFESIFKVIPNIKSVFIIILHSSPGNKSPLSLNGILWQPGCRCRSLRSSQGICEKYAIRLGMETENIVRVRTQNSLRSPNFELSDNVVKLKWGKSLLSFSCSIKKELADYRITHEKALSIQCQFLDILCNLHKYASQWQNFFSKFVPVLVPTALLLHKLLWCSHWLR